MIRPLRRIRERDCELADPAAHRPDRPQWQCVADGEDWPCEPLRNHLLATMSPQDIGMAMAERYVFAVRELADPSVVVYRRFFSWIRGS